MRGASVIHSFVTPAQAGVGLYSASETSQQPTVGQGIIKDPIPAFAGMTMGESKVIKTLSSWAPPRMTKGRDGKEQCRKYCVFFALFEKTLLVCCRKCCTHVDVLRIRVGCSTTRTPLRIARPIVLTTALTTPTAMPLCGLGCSGRSAPWKGI